MTLKRCGFKARNKYYFPSLFPSPFLSLSLSLSYSGAAVAHRLHFNFNVVSSVGVRRIRVLFLSAFSSFCGREISRGEKENEERKRSKQAVGIS